MDPFLQHLKTAPAPASSEAVKQLVRLEDLDRHTGSQTAPRFVVDPVTRRMTLALHTIPAGAADSAPYDRNYPSSPISASSLEPASLAARTRAVLARLETDMDQPQQQVAVILPGTRQNATLTTVTGFAAGVDVSSPFTVAWLGGDSWRVAGGRISGGGFESNARTVEGADVSLRVGFIGFWCRLEPTWKPGPEEGTEVLGVILTPRGISAESSYANAGPTISAEDDSVTWQPGQMFVPLAWVEAPTSSRRARIIPILSGADLLFPNLYDGPGLPIITSDS